MSLLDLVLGDRAGTYLFVSCVAVIAFAIISAIVDIPLRALHDAGYARPSSVERRLYLRALQALGVVAGVAAFSGGAYLAYLSSSPGPITGNTIGLWGVTNGGFVLAVIIWGVGPPLPRHWGLGLGTFGLGLAALFLLLAAVLRLPFTLGGELESETTHVAFALVTGAILVAVGLCIAAFFSLVAHVVRTAIVLAAVHRRHSDWLSSDWDPTRRPGFRRLPTMRRPTASAGAAGETVPRRLGALDDESE